jgi:hypothetical protein
MIVAIATGHMELVSGASQLAITIADALMKMGHETFIVTRMKGYYSLRYCTGRVKVYGPLEFADIPEPDVAIICHARDFVEMKNLGNRVFYVMGTSKPDMPTFEIDNYIASSEELKHYLEFLGVTVDKVINGAVDLPRLKVGPPLRKTKPKVLIATTKNIPRDEWYEGCEKLGWEVYDPSNPGVYPIPNLHDHYPQVDIVIGTETVPVEALAANRAAFIAGPWGFDGWVTPENAKELRLHANSGRRYAHSLDDMWDALAEYKPAMGEYGRDLCEELYNPIDCASQLLEMATA